MVVLQLILSLSFQILHKLFFLLNIFQLLLNKVIYAIYPFIILDFLKSNLQFKLLILIIIFLKEKLFLLILLLLFTSI
jgi:hypothetical protein